MLIKEYRIPLPLSVEEYRIAQLYMIAKKSRTESIGKSSGVEILKNEPYIDEKTNQKGQYTLKNYYVSSLVPSWLKALFNNSTVKEEAWNCYPFTKTIYTCSFSDRFFIEIDTYYYNDPGLKEDVFKLDETESANYAIDFIDIVRDQPSSDDPQNEDPLHFVSKKTKRGPLTENWLQEYTEEYKMCMEKGIKPKNNIMCAYKLCKIKVNVWAAQQRIERFIDDFAKRKVMLSAHRQAWCWQDEWYGLTMEDIRKIELETQKMLTEKMNQDKKSKSSFYGEEFFGWKKSKSRQCSVDNTDNNFNNIGWGIKKLDNELGDSDDEDFDAREDVNSLCKWSSLECVNNFDDETPLSDRLENFKMNQFSISKAPHNLGEESLPCTYEQKSKKCPYLAFIFVLHGGHLLDTSTELNNKYFDYAVFESTLQKIMSTYYSSLLGQIKFKLISCPSICKSSLQFISKLSSSYQANGKFDHANMPIDCLPLFAVNSGDYQNQVQTTMNNINQTFKEFIESEEGENFNGRISFVCDFVGGILGYDSLCNLSPNTTDDNDIDEKTHKAKYDFQVDDLFLLGCPISIILAYRKLTSNASIQKPHCAQVYNLFHSMDRLAMRLEPLIESKFTEIAPIFVPKFNKRIILRQIISIEKHMKFNEKILTQNCDDEVENFSNTNESTEDDFNSNLQKILNRWWGNKRIDYELYCPHIINNLPSNTLQILFHSNYWESNDVVAFILDKLLYEINPDYYYKTQKLEDKIICNPKEKWLKKSTSFKIKNINANHRANDIIVKEGQEQTLTARFIYGPLDVVTLIGEKVDIYLLKDLKKDDWTFLGTEFTDKAGRIYHTIQKPLDCGIYPIKMIVRGDHSSIDFFLSILPPRTESVVFSIDGSFAASLSVTGKDPKVRPGAVDVVRFWHDLGYLIIYITGRPGMQQQKVLTWLSDHCFPHGLIYFTGSLTTDPLRHKATYLQRLQQEVELSINAAYGSAKDIWVYQTLGLSSHKIFIVGNVSKKQQNLANIICDGYANHLEELRLTDLCKQANNNKIALPRGNFGLCNFIGFSGIRLRQKSKTIRTVSHPVSTSAINTPRLFNKFSSNTLAISNNTLNSFKSVSVNHSPTITNLNLFTNFFNNRNSKKSEEIKFE